MWGGGAAETPRTGSNWVPRRYRTLLMFCNDSSQLSEGPVWNLWILVLLGTVLVPYSLKWVCRVKHTHRAAESRWVQIGSCCRSPTPSLSAVLSPPPHNFSPSPTSLVSVSPCYRYEEKRWRGWSLARLTVCCFFLYKFKETLFKRLYFSLQLKQVTVDINTGNN